MVELIKSRPKRFFAFGCSFTNTISTGWADIIARELKVPYYNFAIGGAGNQFIFNRLMQADSYYNFNENDLVIVCWTNVSREDRVVNKQWIIPGNIYSQKVYDQKFVEKWADPLWYAIRDFATIKASSEFLSSKKLQYHFLKMIDFEILDQWHPENRLENTSQELINLYKPYLDKVNRSYYDVLWGNDVNLRFEIEKTEIGESFRDGHPSVAEHMRYLQAIFDHKFSEDTVNATRIAHELTVNALKENYLKIDYSQYINVMPPESRIATQYHQPLKVFI